MYIMRKAVRWIQEGSCWMKGTTTPSGSFQREQPWLSWGGDFVMVMAVLWADSLADLCFLGSGWCAAGRTRLYRNTRAEQVVAGGRAARCCHPSTFPPWELQGKKPNGKIPTLQPSSGEKSSKAVLSSPNNLPSGVVSGWPHKTLGS